MIESEIEQTETEMATETRPTKAQFLSMGHAQRRHFIKPLNENGDHFTHHEITALRAQRAGRLKRNQNRAPTVINGKHHTQKSQGVRRASN